ncbi:hypothetical protein XENTR_v10014545 [Xenopus tropicalis]|nr:hypothetical protein XENTR_v10014545 [Xenopus tropicalis]
MAILGRNLTLDLFFSSFQAKLQTSTKSCVHSFPCRGTRMAPLNSCRCALSRNVWFVGVISQVGGVLTKKLQGVHLESSPKLSS